MKNLNGKNSQFQNQTAPTGESQTRKRIKSKIIEIFLKRIMKYSGQKKTYSYGIINLRKGTITRAIAEY